MRKAWEGPTAKATRRQACGQHAEAEPGHKRAQPTAGRWTVRGGGEGHQRQRQHGGRHVGSTRRRSRGTNVHNQRQAGGRHAEAERGTNGKGNTAAGRWAARGGGAGAQTATRASPQRQAACGQRRRSERQRQSQKQHAGGKKDRWKQRWSGQVQQQSQQQRQMWQQQVEVERPGTTAQQVTTAVGGSTRRCGAQGTEAIESQIICENRFYQPKDIKYEDMQLSAFKVCIEPD